MISNNEGLNSLRELFVIDIPIFNQINLVKINLELENEKNALTNDIVKLANIQQDLNKDNSSKYNELQLKINDLNTLSQKLIEKNSGYDLRIEEKHRMIVDLQKNIDDYRQELKQLQHQKTIHQQTKTFKNKKTEINLNEPTTNEKNETNEKKEEKEGIETNRKPFFIIQKQEEIIPIIDLKSEKEIILPQVANIDLNYQHAIKTLKKEKQKNRKIVNFKELLYSYENDKYSIRIKKRNIQKLKGILMKILIY